ncbi:hypothetical protein QAD02_016324 [Eretmocerus hayati]|uniref:Uncharacterized protein n=1 Tax=Eretmocerus hayati TaxID=131215 RepID=A0ACC2PAS6_9HYME|nr:hypothetical protein QAD02_016324 [Eretmocerus hayati]
MSNGIEIVTRGRNECQKKLTLKDVLVVAQRAFNDPSVKVVDYTIDDYSQDKLGFAGCHQSLKIIVQRKTTDDYKEVSFFMKSIPNDCEELANYIRQQGVFDGESSFYEMIIPELMKNYTGGKWSSECYLVKEDVMVLEDLRSKNYQVLGCFFDTPVVLKAALTTLAQLHGCSILAETRLNHLSKNSLTLKDRYPDCFRERVFDRSKKSAKWYNSGVNAVVAVAEHLGYNDSQELRGTFELLYDIVKPSEKYFNTITHADLWTNNLMFDDTKPIPRCILIDYQLFRYAPMVLDILMLLYLNTTRKFRLSKGKELIQFYHSVLEKTVVENDSTSKKAKCPSLKQILAEYEELRLYGPALACLYFPVVLLNSKDAELYTKDSESYHNFFYVNRTSTTLEHIEKDPFFKERIEEVVAEMIEISKCCSIHSIHAS